MKNYFVTLCLLLMMSNITANSIKTTLKGEVIDRPESTHLILFKDFSGLHDNRGVVHIPITAGKFEYVLNSENIEMYYLAFKDDFESGGFSYVTFFSEPGVINFTLYPRDRFRSENKVEGGKLTTEYQDFFRKIQKIEDEADSEDSLFVRHAKIFDWQLQYAKDNPTLIGYYVLESTASSIVRMTRQNEYHDISPFIELYHTIFAPKFGDHPYTEQLEKLFASPVVKTMLNTSSPVMFVDFTTNDLNGNSVTLSEQIAGKPAVLHLWASWCAPCIRKGLELIPIYEEFHNKGFVVIGVARERNNATAAKIAVERHKFPWKNLVELNDTENVWEKYGVSGAGEIFLIDENGMIVATNPSIEKIRIFLINKYQ